MEEGDKNMSELSEEEILKYIKDEIENETDTFHWFDDNPNNNTRKQIEESINAHQGLLDFYEKEKEKNKTLEELLQGRLFELYKYYKDLASEYQANCVSKSKIKPIQIIDLDGKIHNVYKIEEE